ncbi:MAG TPA: sugar ABC transporter permease [Herpetosiphonaceae bacterium]
MAESTVHPPSKALVAQPTLSHRLRASATALLFLLPAAALVITFFIVPVIITLYISMTDMSTSTFSDPNFIGLQNYSRMFRSGAMGKIVRNTVFYVGTTLALFNVGMALVIALLTTHIPRRSGAFFRALWLLPRITPSVVYIMIWKYLAADAPFGVFNQVLQPLGIAPENWVLAAPWTMVILVNGFIGASFGMIIFTSAIESIPESYLHASRVDGATALQTIRYVILPLLRWPLLFVMTYQTLSLMTSFEQILLLTDGGPGYYTTETWALQAYHRALSNYFGNVNFGLGAALAAVLVLIGVILAIVYLRVFRFGELVQEPKIETL